MMEAKMSTALTIGTLAELAEVNVETIRYYQRRGLLQEPSRPAGGFRHYPPEAVQRVRFIKRAQKLGFTLEEIGNLLELEDGTQCAEAREIAAHKLEMIEEKLRDLSAMRDTLKELVRACAMGKDTRHCPIIETLSESA
jgi:MerR family mercuric resistance operon transcriptional regulator